MNIGPNTLTLAEKAIGNRTADAVVDAIRMTQRNGGDHPTIDTIRTSAVIFRAPMRCVAACLGYLRCEHCGEWIDIACEPREGDGCQHVGEADRADVYGALGIYRVCGGELNAPYTLPRGVAERVKQTTGRTPDAQSPAHDAKAT